MLNEFPIFDYEDIQLIPNKCVIKSRAEADTSVTLGNHTFKLPVVPANMQTILDENVAEQLAKGGYFYIMHRFDEAGRIPFIKRMHDQGLIASISRDRSNEPLIVHAFNKRNTSCLIKTMHNVEVTTFSQLLCYIFIQNCLHISWHNR